MTFVAQRIRKSTKNINPGQHWLVASIQTTRASDGDTTDGTSHEDSASRVPGGVPPGKNIMKISGPVTVHGYSVRVFSDFFGSVQQGLSTHDYPQTTEDLSNNRVHALGMSNAATDGDGDSSRLAQMETNSIKNLEYIDGYRYQPARDYLDNLMGLASSGVPTSAEYAVNFPKGLRLGRAHLQKKFDRTKLRHVGGGKYRKQKKSGFVLVPNTDTEFMSISITNQQHSDSEVSDEWDGWAYVDCVIWMSYDNV